MGKQYEKNRKKSQKKRTSSLSIEPILALSDSNYSVNHIVSSRSIIGHLGVFSNGMFRYSFTQENVNETEVLLFLNTYILEELHLEPVLDPRLS